MAAKPGMSATPDLGIFCMTRKQALILNILGVGCAVVIIGNLVIASLNGRLNNRITSAQTQVQRVQSLQNTMNNLVNQAMQAGEKDPAIKRLLIRHRFVLPDPQPAKR